MRPDPEGELVEITDKIRRAARESVLAPCKHVRALAFRVICDYDDALLAEAQKMRKRKPQRRAKDCHGSG